MTKPIRVRWKDDFVRKTHHKEESLAISVSQSLYENKADFRRPSKL